MKRKFTTQKSANRHPRKINFNFIETMPVWRRRQEGYSRPIDSALHDEEIKRRADKNAKSEEKYLLPYGFNTGLVPTPNDAND